MLRCKGKGLCEWDLQIESGLSAQTEYKGCHSVYFLADIIMLSTYC